MTRMLKALVVVCVLLALSVPALGQSTGGVWLGAGAIAPGAGPMATYSDAGHGWVAVQTPGEEPVAIVHLPPRKASASGEYPASGDGAVRLAARSPRRPSMLAAAGDRVYMVFETRARGGAVSSRAVYSVRAIFSGVADLWRYEPQGSFDVLADLPNDGRLLGFAATGDGTLAALIDVSTVPEEFEPALYRLIGGAWKNVELPGELTAMAGAARGRDVRLVSRRAGVALYFADQQGVLTTWTLSADASAGHAEQSPTPDPLSEGFDEEAFLDREPEPVRFVPAWKIERVQLSAGIMQDTGLAEQRLLEVAGRLVMAQRTLGGELVLTALNGGNAYELCRVKDVPSECAIAPLDAVARVAVLWTQKDPAREAPGLGVGGEASHQEIREISVFTGRMMYAGRVNSSGPVTRSDFRILATVLFGLMGLVLLIVLRPDSDDGVITLPEGYSLADPLRRAMAWLADGMLALGVASAVWGVDAMDVLSPALVVSKTLWFVLASALGTGAVLGTVSEWRTGRSLGKWMVGIRVIAVGTGGKPTPELRNPSLGRAFTRNAIKWLLPPVAMLGAIDPTGRHRADGLARTAVVVEDPPEASVDEP